MSDDRHDDDMAEERQPDRLKASVRSMPVWLIILVAVAIGLLGGAMVEALWVSMMGEQQGPGLDNASAIDRCAEPLDDAPLAADQQLEGAMIGPAEPPRKAPEQ